MSDVPVGDHAFLSDARTSALVTSTGSVDWLCLPRFDSPAVHARLLDPQAGHFELRPVDRDATARRRYLPHTLVLETTWTTGTGQLVVRDALALGASERGHDIGRDSPGILLRDARCTRGRVDVALDWAPRPEYGLVHPRLSGIDGGVLALGGATALLLSTDLPLDLAGSTARGQVVLEEGDQLAVALHQADPWGPAEEPWPASWVRDRLDATVDGWQSWSGLHQSYEGPLAELVHRSGVVLQGLTYARTGAILAAATTSLPEGVGTGRTWDYRYTWVRDASMTMRGLWVAACPDEAIRFFRFLATAATSQVNRGRPIQIMFGIGGEQDLSERTLRHLTGWRDSSPVRVGNGAWDQQQHDVPGALLDAALVLRDYLDDLDEPARELLVAAVESAAESWAQPDQGIWEMRGPPRRHLHSALMCWVALDRGIALAELLDSTDREAAWTTTRNEIKDAILTLGWSDRLGAFAQSLGGHDLDASSLLVGLVGILPTTDPRVGATVDAVAAGLTDERGLVRRYLNDDGLSGEEGSFLLCTFWLAEALAVLGRVDESDTVLRRGAGYANDLGLFAEQVDTASGEQLGNFPQAFSHLGLVLAAQALAQARRRLQPTEEGDDPTGRPHGYR